MFIDESGFLLIPTRRRTWGPQGQTPLIHYSYRHDRISALAALTMSARRKHVGLYVRFQQDNFKAWHVANFLRALLRHLPGEVVLLWDRGRIHMGPAVRTVQRAFPRLHLEWFPGYAPELNPVEQVWNDFKGRTANSMPLEKNDIRQSLHANSRRARRSQTKLRAYINSSDLPFPFRW